jgi:hypothetical protein
MIEKNSNIETHTVGLRPAAAFLGARFLTPMTLAALCVRRMGKGIYRFDPNLLQEF